MQNMSESVARARDSSGAEGRAAGGAVCTHEKLVDKQTNRDPEEVKR